MFTTVLGTVKSCDNKDNTVTEGWNVEGGGGGRVWGGGDSMADSCQCMAKPTIS